MQIAISSFIEKNDTTCGLARGRLLKTGEQRFDLYRERPGPG